jgi:hypothetical protein
MTEAERKHKDVLRKRHEELLAQNKVKSHREKIDEFNQKI